MRQARAERSCTRLLAGLLTVAGVARACAVARAQDEHILEAPQLRSLPAVVVPPDVLPPKDDQVE